MATFKQILRQLRTQERKLLKELKSVRDAMATLTFGSSVSPALPRATTRVRRTRTRRSKK